MSWSRCNANPRLSCVLLDKDYLIWTSLATFPPGGWAVRNYLVSWSLVMCRSSNPFRGFTHYWVTCKIASSFTGSNIFLFECLICCMPLCRPFVFALSPNLRLFSSWYICFCRTSSSSVAYWNSSLLLPKSLRRNPDSDEQDFSRVRSNLVL